MWSRNDNFLSFRRKDNRWSISRRSICCYETTLSWLWSTIQTSSWLDIPLSLSSFQLSMNSVKVSTTEAPFFKNNQLLERLSMFPLSISQTLKVIGECKPFSSLFPHWNEVDYSPFHSQSRFWLIQSLSTLFPSLWTDSWKCLQNIVTACYKNIWF